MCDPCYSQWDEKMQFLLLLLFALTFLSEMKVYNFRGIQSKKLFELILHVGRVTSLQSWVAKKSCHGQILINKCSISDYPSNFEIIFHVGRVTSFQTVFCFAFLGSYIFISDQKVKAKSNRNRNCIFSSPWE